MTKLRRSHSVSILDPAGEVGKEMCKDGFIGKNKSFFDEFWGEFKSIKTCQRVQTKDLALVVWKKPSGLGVGEGCSVDD